MILDVYLICCVNINLFLIHISKTEEQERFHRWEYFKPFGSYLFSKNHHFISCTESVFTDFKIKTELLCCMKCKGLLC
ncbi:hypothetical protein C0J52_13758 [Blattella germanica]|nr:hypothetical protein C0J52_13758 [Blattella germanica]